MNYRKLIKIINRNLIYTFIFSTLSFNSLASELKEGEGQPQYSHRSVSYLDDLIPNKIAKSANTGQPLKGIATGILYAVKNAQCGRYLRSGGGEDESSTLTTEKQGPSHHGEWALWVLEEYNNGRYTSYKIRNALSKRYLKSGWGEDESSTPSANKNGLDYHADWILWRLEEYSNGRYLIQNAQCGRYLRSGGNEGESSTPSTNKNGLNYHADWILWRFIPFNYKFNAVISNFRFQADFLDLLTKNKKVGYVQKTTLEVDEANVGGQVSYTYKQSVTDATNWTIKNGFNAKISAKIKASIPFIASESLQIETGYSYENSTGGSQSKTKEVTLTATMRPLEAGLHEMIGWTYVVENLTFPFTATATYGSEGQRVKNNFKLVLNAAVDKEGVSAFLLQATGDGSLTQTIGGDMTGSYGMESHIALRKVRDAGRGVE